MVSKFPSWTINIIFKKLEDLGYALYLHSRLVDIHVCELFEDTDLVLFISMLLKELCLTDEWKWMLCLAFCDPVDCSLPCFSVRGILQARILEWAAILNSRDFPDPEIEPGSPAL